jgi:ABC-type Na+ efflux pump permease subunit
MTFLPIVNRELRVASRRRGTYWVRSSAALGLILVGAWLFLVMQHEPPRTVAMTLFGVLTGGAVLYAMLSGVRATADCMSEEKREGTLGLLFLTDLRGYDVVLGKLVASSVNAFYGMLAILPMLGIPLLMGGITAGEFARMVLLAVNSLLWSLALGIWVSTNSRSAQRAGLATLSLLLIVAAGLPALGAILAALGRVPRVEAIFLLPSPGFGYYLAFDAPFKTQPNLYWICQTCLAVMSGVALVLASLRAPYSWQDRPVGTRALQWREQWRQWGFGDTTERRGFRQRLLDRNPFFWLASRARLKPALVWGMLGLLACIWTWGLAKYRHDWLNETMYVGTALVLNFLLRAWFAAEAARQLAEDRKAGTLELLLSTPLSVREILHGQWLALQRQFLWPVALVLAVECLFMFAISSEATLQDSRADWAAFWICLMVMLAADLVAIYWIGMWQALTARNPARAASNTVAIVFVLPWGLIALTMLVVVMGPFGGSSTDDGWKLFLGMWFVSGILVDLLFALKARSNLIDRFRLTAQQRYALRPGFWRSLIAPRAGAAAAPPVPEK